MAGFGGDARLAMLAGVVGGQNRKAKEQADAERQAILNRLAQVQIEQAQTNMKVAQENADRAMEDTQSRNTLAWAKVARESARLVAMGRLIQRLHPELHLSDEDAQALAGQVTGSSLLGVLGMKSAVPMTPLQKVQVASAQLQLDQKRKLNALENSAAGDALRKAVQHPDYASQEEGARASARAAGFDDATINAYEDGIRHSQVLDKQGQPSIRPTPAQGSYYEEQGKVIAQGLVQKLGSASKALNWMGQQGPMGPDDQLYKPTMDALNDILKQSGEGVINAIAGPSGGESPAPADASAVGGGNGVLPNPER